MLGNPVDGEAESHGTQRALAALMRLSAPPADDAAGASRLRARRMLSASRFVVLLAVLAMAATLVCAAIGYGVARASDEHLWSTQRAALRNAIAEFRRAVRNLRRGSIRACVHHDRAERGPEGAEIRDRTDGGAGAKCSRCSMPRAHRRLLHLGAQLSDDTNGEAAAAADRRHGVRAGRLCRLLAAPVAARAPAIWRAARRRPAAPARPTSSPGCPTTPRRSSCWIVALAERAGDEVSIRADRARRHGRRQRPARRAGGRRVRGGGGAAAERGDAGGGRYAAASAATNSRCC